MGQSSENRIEGRRLGVEGPLVGALGLGCLHMTRPGSDETEATATFHHAINCGVTLFDTADSYDDGANESFVGRAVSGRRQAILIATKCGLRISDNGSSLIINGRPEHIIASCEASLRRLSVDVIDLYFQHRVDPTVPVEESIGAMARLVEQGKVRWLGMSEAKAKEIERAMTVHTITALQSEYSLWLRNVEAEVLPTIRRHGISLVPFSPLGRGMLTGQIKDPTDLAPDDRRLRYLPFKKEIFERNRPALRSVADMAAAKSCTPGQLALAWLLAQGADIIPIPGTKRRSHLDENLAAVSINVTASESALLREVVPSAAGARFEM